MSPPSWSFSKTLRTSPSGNGLIFAIERTSHSPLILDRMNASFGVNDQDMSSSIGRVSDGMDSVSAIESTPTEAGDRPAEDQVIERIELSD